MKNPVDSEIETFRGHASIIRSTKENVFPGFFCLQQTETNVIQKEINRLNCKSIGTFSNLTPKFLAEVSEISLQVLCQIWNYEISTSKTFPTKS